MPRLFSGSVHGGANQQWRLEPVADGYQLVAGHSGKCVDVRGESTNDGGFHHPVAVHGRRESDMAAAPGEHGCTGAGAVRIER